MNKLLLTLVLCVLTSYPAYAGDIVVIVNQSNSTAELSQRDLIDLYMGKNLAFPDGDSADTYDLDMGSEVREHFYRSLVNKSVAQVNAYWARLLFTGRVKPPKEVTDSRAIIELVRTNPSAIGYIDSNYLDASVKEVYRIH